jgi:hypothetical protein
MSSYSSAALSPSSSSPFLHSMIPPPVDFKSLGPMAILGDFDGLTPVLTQGQQNAFEGQTFSILEMAKVPPTTGPHAPHQPSSSRQEESLLSVPVLLASFSIEGAGSTKNWIRSTCVLDQAPHQVYIGGYFKQILTAADVPSNNSNSNNNASYVGSGNSASTGLNYIGMYDSRLRRFLALDNGLDGPVEDLLCDSSSNQVFVVGKFRAPLQEGEVTSSGDVSNRDTSGSNYNGKGNSNYYQALGDFGGGVAVWQKGVVAAPESSSNTGSSVLTKATGSWVALPFKGLNGIVTSAARAQDGTYYFGGQFDTTTDGEYYSAPDTQPVNMDSVTVSLSLPSCLKLNTKAG